MDLKTCVILVLEGRLTFLVKHPGAILLTLSLPSLVWSIQVKPSGGVDLKHKPAAPLLLCLRFLLSAVSASEMDHTSLLAEEMKTEKQGAKAVFTGASNRGVMVQDSRTSCS